MTVEMTRRGFTGLVAAGAAVTGLPRWAAAATTLKYANAAGPQTLSNVFNAKYLQALKDATGGAVDYTMSFNVAGEKTIVDSLALGSVDISVTAYTGTREFDIMYSPYMFKDGAQAKRVFKGPIGQKASAVLEKRYRSRLLGVGRLGPYALFTKDPISSLEDLQGKKIRTPAIEGCIEAVKHIGANPTPVPFNEVYLALQQGLVDGMVTALNVAVGQKFYEVCKYVVANPFGEALDKEMISLSAWGRLSEKEQETVQSLFDSMEQSDYYQAGVDAIAANHKIWEENNGAGTVLSLDQAKLEALMEPLNKKLANEVFGDGAWEMIQSA